MAYWVKAYCTTDTVPTIRKFVTWLRRQLKLKAEAIVEDENELDDPNWTGFELLYNPKKESLLVECNRASDTDSLCKDEVEGELSSLEDLDDSPAKAKVVDYLSRTQFVICCTIEQDERHREALQVRTLLNYFIKQCDAILDTEDEGFYSAPDKPLLGNCADD